MKHRILAALALAACALPLAARQPSALDDLVNALTFRNIGPFRTAAWVTAVAVPDAPLHDHLYTIYAATPLRWTVEDDECRDHVEADFRSRRRCCRRARWPSRRRTRRSSGWATGDQANARSSYSGKGVFKSTDAGADVAVHGAARLAPHRAHRHPPVESGHRLRRRHGPPVLVNEERGDIPHARRRQDVEEGALRQRSRRRDRSRDESPLAADVIRRDVRQAAAAMGNRRERTRERRLPHRRWRRSLDAASGGTADGKDRPDRPRSLPEESIDSLRADREPEPQVRHGGPHRWTR